MLNLSVCLEFFWTDLPLDARVAAAKAAGFDAGEIWAWRGRDLRALRDAADAAGFSWVSMCALEPKPGFGDRHEHTRLHDDVHAAIEAASVLGCRQLIVMGGMTLPGVSREAQIDATVEGLAAVADAAHARGQVLALEALNSRRAFPGYFMDNAVDQLEVVRRVNHPGVRAVFDLFHAGMMGPVDASHVLENLTLIESFHLAGRPDRHEPDDEADRTLLRKAAAAGFNGRVGLEYAPTSDSAGSLGKTRTWLTA